MVEKKQCVKSVQIRSFSWSVFSRIRTEYGEILRRTRYTDQKFFVFGHISRSEVFPRMRNICLISSFILYLYKFAMDMFFGYFLRKKQMKKKGETNKYFPTDFRVSVIQKLANTFETKMNDS